LARDEACRGWAAPLALVVCMAQAVAAGPAAQGSERAPMRTDWLIDAPGRKAACAVSADGSEIALDNGLIRRVFRLKPNAAAIAFDNLMTGQALLRAVKPEAGVELDGVVYAVGGLTGQPDLAFLRPEWLDAMRAEPAAFQLSGYEIGTTAAPFGWKRSRPSEGRPWPPPGAALALHFAPPQGKLAGISVDVHYELYDGLPALAKWLVVHNSGTRPVQIDHFTSEILGVVESESVVDPTERWTPPSIELLSDYAFGGGTPQNSNHTTYWMPDPAYATQVSYELKTPCLLESRPPLGPGIEIVPRSSFTTFRTFELVYDSTDRERRGLALRRFYRTLAPWSTESPLMLHLTSTDPQIARAAIDQCAEVGFEMVILSFGSGLNMEDTSPANIARFKALADYAHGKGLQIGGYSLLASRRISDQDDVIDPKTGKPGGAIFGSSPCLGSRWGLAYFEHIRAFLEQTGFDLLEHDGSYPGDVCASTTHPGHKGLEDSQWTQFQQIAALYRWCRERGIYLNVPDWYFLSGSNKTAMGYRESNWSLPRAEQHIHARQNLYDGTWEKAPTMGWMFTPLVQYHGGGAAATIEPLREHLPDYEQHLANNLGYGAQACYRGPRLYDSPETKALVVKWVRWFKEHRTILESDVIHLRRADARDLDAILHVNPSLPEKGLAVFYNPTSRPITREWDLPLHDTGLKSRARIRQETGPERVFTLDRAGNARLSVTVKPHGVTWFVVR